MMSALLQPNSEDKENLRVVEEIDLSQLPDDDSNEGSAASEQPEQQTDMADEIAMTKAYGQNALRHHHFVEQKNKIEELKRSRARLEKAHMEIRDALEDHKTICQQLMVVQQMIGHVAACHTNRDADSARELLDGYIESNNRALDCAYVSVLYEFSVDSLNGKQVNASRRKLIADHAKWTEALNDSETALIGLL